MSTLNQHEGDIYGISWTFIFELFFKQECSKVLLVYPDDVNKFVSNVDFRCLAESLYCILHVWSLQEVSL